MSSRFTKALVGLAISMLLGILVFGWLDFSKIAYLFLSIDFTLAALALGLYVVSVALRSIRWKTLDLTNQLSVYRWFAVTSIHNTLNLLLPARLGELSFLFLTRKISNLPLSHSFSFLIIVRLLDLFVLCLFLSVGSMIIEVPADYSIVQPIGVGLTIALLLLLLNLRRFTFLLMKALKPFKVRVIRGLCLNLKSIYDLLGDSLSAAKYAELVVNSMLMLTAKLSSYWLLIVAVGSQVPWVKAMVANVFTELSLALPIQSVAAIGTLEAGWALGFAIVGVPPAVSMNYAIFVHTLLLFFSLLLGVTAVFCLLFGSGTSRGASEQPRVNGDIRMSVSQD